ncbi:hypothetical protein CcaverHIS002_0307480 [Cutaneotrichosporon cavernicola]|uniref:Peroxin-14 n=1 Tax=Cutaneotrichosporon cavernicola TaxID=279322 RepID=A0AA48I3P9_9TREE|nr:uncharacterized protein CcaverHIS019_0307390 [Cutaneotrichosporon cavernicola]BEI82880.1 hypothetical protein CcaverHIS002_0307480 [Cutaneotrichosporon cavernicola]BEI90669.1 hypothetical protein CcaverHIS019_0307390 [Cutaneotrichosporon cavernicola]
MPNDPPAPSSAPLGEAVSAPEATVTPPSEASFASPPPIVESPAVPTSAPAAPTESPLTSAPIETAPIETASTSIPPVPAASATVSATSAPETTPAPASAPTPTAPASIPPAYPVIPAAAAAFPPTVTHLKNAPRPLSTLPQQLKRLTYVVSLLVGGSALLAGAWSVFLLPLLHATYSARNAIAGAQKDRWRALLEKLQLVRGLGMFPLALNAEETAERDEAIAKIEAERAEKAAAKEQEKDKQIALPGQEPESPKSAITSLEDEFPPATKPPPVPLRADVGDLSAALKDLAANLDATATTRTSLVSTLEGYTSGLHRELFLARSGGPSTPWGPVPGATNTGRVGLGTLSANLASAGGKVAGQPEPSPLGIPPARSEEWDNVRREVRAIKGLLLNRRNFNVPARAAPTMLERAE